MSPSSTVLGGLRAIFRFYAMGGIALGWRAATVYSKACIAGLPTFSSLTTILPPEKQSAHSVGLNPILMCMRRYEWHASSGAGEGP